MLDHNNRVIYLEDPKSSLKVQTNTIPTPVVSMSDLISDESYKTPSEIEEEKEMQHLIDTCKIDLNEQLAPAPVAMRIMSEGSSITMLTKGNFSIITGAAKSRKTFLISMLMAAAIKGSFQDKFTCEGDGVNILFDTEQAKYKAQQIGKRISHLSERVNPANLNIYTLRHLEPAGRIKLIEHVLANTPHIKFVAIDGIIDLDVDPILQADQAQNIVQKLMEWTTIYNIHIACVLHYNKTVNTLLGHLGSFSHRKADAIIEVSKSKEEGNVSIVKAVDCREEEFTPFAFGVDTKGMPYVLQDYTFKTKDKEAKELKAPKPKAITAQDLAIDKHTEILTLAFKILKEQGYSDLWHNIKNASAELGLSIGDNKAKEFITYYVLKESIILTTLPKKKTPVYTLAGQREMDF